MAGRPNASLPDPPNRIREFRLRFGLTQEKLAEPLGVSAATVAKWETGESSISLPQLENVAKAMGLRAMDLLNA